MRTSLSYADLTALGQALSFAHADVAAAYPGEGTRRQPVHTVYGGAHLFKANTAQKLGALALGALDDYGGEPAELASALVLGLLPSTAETVMARVRAKLAREPVEDIRIDFEDGYGYRADGEEDSHAAKAAAEVAAASRQGLLPPFWGIRIKPLAGELWRRSLRTLDIFVTALVAESGGGISAPGRLVVTLPKITHPEEVAVLVSALERLERVHGLAPGSLVLELMVETTQSLVGLDGAVSLRRLADAAHGRCVAAHFGAYDYTAACGVAAAHQHMMHPACDFARNMMQVALAGTGIALSDGATNILPVAPHRVSESSAAGGSLTEDQIAENARVVRAAWKLHVEHIRHSLACGLYQGWDLHPAQLPSRYMAVYAFFLDALPAASQRLANFARMAAQASLVGDVFDDAATGQGLLNFFLRGLSCGALTEDEALGSGLTLDELRSRSFAAIVAGRRAAAEEKAAP